MRRSTALLCAAALAAAALSGCGGEDGERDGGLRERAAASPASDDLAGSAPGGEPLPRASDRVQRQLREAKQSVLLVVDVLNAKDPGACELFTQRFIESTTELRGAAARRRCELNVRRAHGRNEVIDFRRARLVGGAAEIELELTVGSERERFRVTLVRARDGRWLVDSRAPA